MISSKSVPITAPPRAEDGLIALNRSVVRQLASYNKKILDDYRALMRTVRTDAISSVNDYVSVLVAKYGKWFSDHLGIATRSIDLISSTAIIGNAIRFNANIAKSLTRSGKKEYIKDFSIGHEEGIPRLISSQWKERQLALIKKDGSPGAFDTPSIPQDHFDRLSKIIQDGVHNGTRWEDIRAELQMLKGVSSRRAELIARDQIGKYNGKMTQARSQSVGITHYYWRTVGDASVRPEHRARDGQRFAYASPPSDGAPGEPIQCRCYADPDIEAAINAKRQGRS